tara:strand:- start:5968 stop:6249 length:282 start_codon:yes stop_codon:yes gene_type:complete
MDIKHEYRNCMYKWNKPLHDSQRLADKSYSTNPMTKYKTVMEIGKPKQIKETDVFNFGDKVSKPKLMSREKGHKNFAPKKDLVDKKPNMKMGY